MPVIPRVRDTLEVAPVEGVPGQYAVLQDDGSELFRLTADGLFLLCQLDGRTTPEDLLLLFEEQFDRDMPPAELAGFLDSLADARLFVEEPRALSALRYLLDQELSWRGALADRRAQGAGSDSERRSGGARREGGSVVTQWWDHAVFHVNAGNLEHAVEVFERMADAAPGDMRLREMASHLRFLLGSEASGAPLVDRRDVTWEVFDAVLGDMLSNGLCPRCSTPFHVELGKVNRCSGCGASFSTWILGHAGKTRRSSDGLFRAHE